MKQYAYLYMLAAYDENKIIPVLHTVGTDRISVGRAYQPTTRYA